MDSNFCMSPCQLSNRNISNYLVYHRKTMDGLNVWNGTFFLVRNCLIHHEVLPLIIWFDVWASNSKEFLFMLTWWLSLNKCLAYLQTSSVSQSLFCSSKKNFNHKQHQIGYSRTKGQTYRLSIDAYVTFSLCSLFQKCNTYSWCIDDILIYCFNIHYPFPAMSN